MSRGPASLWFWNPVSTVMAKSGPLLLVLHVHCPKAVPPHNSRERYSHCSPRSWLSSQSHHSPQWPCSHKSTLISGANGAGEGAWLVTNKWCWASWWSVTSTVLSLRSAVIHSLACRWETDCTHGRSLSAKGRWFHSRQMSVSLLNFHLGALRRKGFFLSGCGVCHQKISGLGL